MGKKLIRPLTIKEWARLVGLVEDKLDSASPEQRIRYEGLLKKVENATTTYEEGDDDADSN